MVTHPNDGERIQSKNIYVPRSGIRSNINRVDQHGIQQQMLTTIQRRTYYVKRPNYAWHMDSNHNLIRRKFIIHGAIDIYSQLAVFLKCSTNNTTAKAFYFFISATQSYGVPKNFSFDAWLYRGQLSWRK